MSLGRKKTIHQKKGNTVPLETAAVAKKKNERTEKDSFVIERECKSQNSCQHRRIEAWNAGWAVARLAPDTQRTPNPPYQEDELYVFPPEVQKIGLPCRDRDLNFVKVPTTKPFPEILGKLSESDTDHIWHLPVATGPVFVKLQGAWKSSEKFILNVASWDLPTRDLLRSGWYLGIDIINKQHW